MGVELPLRVVVTILECCVTFSGVKLSIRSFVDLAQAKHLCDHQSTRVVQYLQYLQVFLQCKDVFVGSAI